MRLMSSLLAGLALAASGAHAQDSAADLRAYLYDGRIAEGLETLSVRAEAGDGAAAFGVGFLTFVEGVEGLARAFNRHGFDPERGIAVSPLLGMPSTSAPRQVAPETLSYDEFRAYIDAFVTTMDAAHDLLLAASEDTGFAVEIDIMQIRIDIDGDGVASELESIGAFLGQAAGMAPEFGLDGDFEDIPPARFAFDAADAIWLAGYSQVLAFHADFLMAHDFSDFFAAAMHRFFPGAGLPMERIVPAEGLFMDRDTDTLIADAIAAIHTLNWPVIDRARFARAHERLGTVIALSRRNWAAILAETDDNLEFIPNPAQTPVHEDMRITKAMVTAWLETLDGLERIVAGDLLLPHWRFRNLGFDVKLFFETADRTDFVLLFTGIDAVPFMRAGEIAGPESFPAANEVFGDAIWGYALWFN